MTSRGKGRRGEREERRGRLCKMEGMGEEGGAGKRRRTREGVVLKRSVPDGVVYNVASTDGKGGVGRHVGNGGVHAVREAHGRVAVVVAVGPRGGVADAGLVVLRVGPLSVSIFVARLPSLSGCCLPRIGRE